ncbi:MAG: hypothetical protein LBC43_02910 [Bifidobacteriaceae bacterium]|jgi:hypothetical protein|nr:hypothetical protein [Bifidobacteriaceae bacterium]
MELFKYAGKTLRIVFDDGMTISGHAFGFSSAPNNEESGEDELYVRTDDQRVIGVTPSEISSIQVLEPAQSKKRFPLVAASL